MSWFTPILACIRRLGSVGQILLCATIGLCVGLALNLSHAAPEWRVWLGMPGSIYLRTLTLLIVPLVFCSVVSGIGSLQGLGVNTAFIGGITGALYVLTTIVACVEGLVITFILSPLWKSASNVKEYNGTDPRVEPETDPISDSFQGLIEGMFPRNLFGIFTGTTGSPNMLGMIVFSSLFAVALTRVKKAGKTDYLSPLIDNILDVTTVLTIGVASFTPPAVGSLVLSAVAARPLDELGEGMGSLAIVAAGCVFAMLFHVLVFQTSMYSLLARQSPWPHLRALVPASVLAFGTASSAVTLPTTIACCEGRGYDASVTRFVLSLGAAISMDGTALYYSPIILWLADQEGQPVTGGQVLVLAVVSTLTSMGAAPTPGAGTALFLVIWQTLFPGTDDPVGGIAFVAAIDWLIDRFRTCTNVNGDAFVAGIVDAITKRSVSAESGRSHKDDDEPRAITLASLSDKTRSSRLTNGTGSSVRGEIALGRLEEGSAAHAAAI